MSRNGKVVVAMSGGVDSSVAACLLKEQGYECIGVFMRVGAHEPEEKDTNAPQQERAEGSSELELRATEGPEGSEATRRQPSAIHQRPRRHGCCSVGDALDARSVAGRLGMSFYVLNFERDFEPIIEYFVDEYARARTPNPCVLCNIRLKFGKLLRYADMLDAEFVATGHYARILRAGSEARLARAVNLAKDQSYVLFGIRRQDLPRCLFPIGEIADKAHVRRIAAELGLRVHDKPDSQEICFVPDDDYKQLVRTRRPETQRPGEVRDSAGVVLGRHEGIANYTIGQRHGLGIAGARPMYVTQLDVIDNVVTLGPREDLLSGGLVAEQVNWLTDPPPVGKSCAVAIKIRHMHQPAPGSIRVMPDGTVEATFNEPQSAVTPGQVAVFYDGAVVLGGGWIERRL
jgi:tRNA-specific 2-thiouridylase